MELHFYQQEFEKGVAMYTLTAEQLRFTGAPEVAITLAQTDSSRYPIVAIADEQLVTFFCLHKGEGIKTFSANEHAILLRSFSTDFHQQGKGYAKRALAHLPAFIKEHFSDITEIVLAVNVRNEAAQALYRKCGYLDTGRRTMGEKGELIVMRYDL
ncbi:GNAT family N-acetyltransferase [Sporosarcina sp. FSL K6-1522]|uniref:GNAT family N-acetyltransferase n=1 Tax=Sporosarcina sp. FSL K6-1522 TaxID=2921554 RepID=UPI003159B10A